jgi:hypothetical protein
VQFDFLKTQHVIESMIFSVSITTLMPCCYFYHQTTNHHHKLMISTRPLEKKLAHNFEFFFFQSLISYSTRLIIQCQSCTLFFKSNLTLATINNDQQSYILLFMNFIFSFMNRFEHIPTRLIFFLLKKKKSFRS